VDDIRDAKQPMSNERPRTGKVTIAPDVLVTIARLSTLGVSGVARMAPVPVAVDRLFQRHPADGVRIEIKQQSVLVDLYVVVAQDATVRDVSRNVQAAVARAIKDMVGMNVRAVNVHVEDVAFGEASPATG
jgi:uncharacterized alkaline shock family protein YloU